MDKYAKKEELILKIAKIFGRTFKILMFIWALIMAADIYFKFADPYMLLAIISTVIVFIIAAWLAIWGYVEKNYNP
ncbi:MAG: hypothetical protein ACD_2C00088G0001 [uncultured bacterium (gcode 4)]|uniref:Uncharacterized protein n=1 Tax=uncultured bacterium (gcode 4) TaxID=1234023 RepID=K2FF44_9BACT|nr:MAG: hypothetical protein ACD_2C00088G0001 [uncultured bacterium (gcode 4)]